MQYPIIEIPTLLESAFNFLQWPAMAVTLLSTCMVASSSETRRGWGFWSFILSNFLWVLWAWHIHAYALIFMQIGLFLLNVRGLSKNTINAEK